MKCCSLSTVVFTKQHNTVTSDFSQQPENPALFCA